MKARSMKTLLSAVALALALVGSPTVAWAHTGLSDASAASALPIGVSVAVSVAGSVAAPLALGTSALVGGSALTVVAVETVSGATVWVLERASDGARISVTLAGATVAGVSVAAGTTVAVVAFGAGWVLSTAGKAIAFIPNEIGKALMHNERLTR